MTEPKLTEEQGAELAQALAEFQVGPAVARMIAAAEQVACAEAWDEGFKQGGPMHDEDYHDPDKHKRNPYREAKP